MDPHYIDPQEVAMEISEDSEEYQTSTSEIRTNVNNHDASAPEYVVSNSIPPPEPNSEFVVDRFLEENTIQSEGDIPLNDDKEEESCSRKRSYIEEEDDDGTLCPICLDNWTNTGDHRICALKCGHLFGFKCVQRWLQSQTKRSCPTCKKKVGRSDIRYVYAKKLIAVDNTELEAIKKQLDTVIEEKNQVLSDLSKSLYREQVLNHEIVHLKKKIYDMSHKYELHSMKTDQKSNLQNPVIRLFMEKSLEICRFAGCRVLDASCPKDLLVASMKSANNLFNGYGLRKINISYYKPLSFIPTHTQQIRDVSFHPEEMWVISVGMDKAIKIVDLSTNNVVHSVNYQMPLWSCCWDSDNSNYLYAGAQSGSVIKYDIRNIQEPLTTLSVSGDTSPVVSVASVPAQLNQASNKGGIISCKLNSLWFFENSTEYTRHNLPLEGPFVSMKYQQETGQLLVSSRPNSRFPYSRHTVAVLQKQNDNVSCNILDCYQGGGMQKLLSKSCFIKNEIDMVAAYHETSKCVYLWCVNTGHKVASVPAHDAVLDLCGVENSNGNFLLSLTEKKLEFFKFNH